MYAPLFGPHDRVDLVVDDRRGPLRRMQCKSARLARGALSFRVCSNTGNQPRDYRGEIDVFGVYSAELDAVYVVPVADVAATRLCHLRVAPARNGQAVGIRDAEHYRVVLAD